VGEGSEIGEGSLFVGKKKRRRVLRKNPGQICVLKGVKGKEHEEKEKLHPPGKRRGLSFGVVGIVKKGGRVGQKGMMVCGL